MSIEKKKFESYLQDIHAEDYIGTDDDMSDAFDVWLTNLEVNEFILFADLFSKEIYRQEVEYERINIAYKLNEITIKARKGIYSDVLIEIIQYAQDLLKNKLK